MDARRYLTATRLASVDKIRIVESWRHNGEISLDMFTRLLISPLEIGDLGKQQNSRARDTSIRRHCLFFQLGKENYCSIGTIAASKVSHSTVSCALDKPSFRSESQESRSKRDLAHRPAMLIARAQLQKLPKGARRQSSTS